MPWSMLTISKQNVFLAVPDVNAYLMASHIVRLLGWCKHEGHKLWISVEQAQSQTILAGLLWCLHGMPSSIRTHPAICICQICICQRVFQQQDLSSTNFSPSLEGQHFKDLVKRGILRIHHSLSSGS